MLESLYDFYYINAFKLQFFSKNQQLQESRLYNYNIKFIRDYRKNDYFSYRKIQRCIMSRKKEYYLQYKNETIHNSLKVLLMYYHIVMTPKTTLNFIILCLYYDVRRYCFYAY